MVIRQIFKLFMLFMFIACRHCNYNGSAEWHVDLGENITLPCKDEFRPVMWIKRGREEQINRLKILSDGSLSIQSVMKSDSGEYLCKFEKNDNDEKINGKITENGDTVKTKYKLIVRTPPPILVNVSVHPSTVLALLLWDVSDTGGYDISYFSAQYRLKYNPSDVWHDVLPQNISSTARQIDVYHLNPNSTYTFRIWAVNALGIGEITEIDGTTNHIIEEIELARHLLEGAENFDTRIWVVAVAVVMGTLTLLSAGTCYILCRECNFSPFSGGDEEIFELVPNIILNPGFYENEYHTDRLYRGLDVNFNDQAFIRFNNNLVVHPVRL